MAYADSETFDGSVDFQGLWIHDPVDAAGSIAQFLYGRSARQASIESAAVGRLYAGRTYPVYDHGEHQQDKLQVTVDVPFGEDWQASLTALQGFAEARRTLVVRDNRGRAFHGAMDGYSESDTDWGTTVGFTFHRVDHPETTL